MVFLFLELSVWINILKISQIIVMNCRFLTVFFLTWIFIFGYKADAQSSRVPAGLAKYKYFQIPGRVKLDKGDPAGTVVNLINLDSKQTEKSITVSSSGKFDLELSYFKEYQISVVKDGYYTKELHVSTVIPRNVWDKDSIFPPFTIVVTIYKKVEGVVLSFEGKTIGKISYSPNGTLDNFDSNTYIDDQLIQDEINNALKNIEDIAFNKKIAEALEYEKKGDLSTAFSLYSEASKIKPSDKFVKEKLKELAFDLKNLVGEAKIQAEFKRLIALGDTNVARLKYSEAILNFKSALKVIPNEPVAVSKLADAERLLALVGEKAKKDAEFNRLIAVGDEDVKQSKYTEAIGSFKSALEIRPGDAVALARIANAERLVALAGEKAKKDAEFNRLIAVGDEDVKQSKYTEAIGSFKSALEIRPGDAVALARIANAERLIALAGEKAKKDAEFNRLIAVGDEDVKQLKYTEAIGSFKSALEIRPGDAVALVRIANAERLIALAGEKAKKDAEYNRLIAVGDEDVKQSKYTEAIGSFKSALEIRPGDAVALARIANAERLVALAGEKAKKDAEFNRLIAVGDEDVKQLKYTEAIGSFKSALEIRPGDAVALARIANAERLVALEGEKAKKDAEFNRLIAVGDEDVKQSKYAEAIGSFKSALEIRPGDAVALARIANAERLIALAGEKAKKDAEFNRLIAVGDEDVKQSKYTEAIGSFKSALEIRPGDAVALARIANAERLVALAGEKAKKDEEFNRLIAVGDEDVKQSKYAEAIGSFKSALEIRPGDAVALARIANAERLVALAGEKAKMDAEFNRLIAVGDEDVKQSKYAEAIGRFKSALEIRPGDAVALARIANAERLVALAGEKAKKDAEYNRLIAVGDEDVKQSKYTEAIGSFKSALEIRPGDAVALARIANAERLIALAGEKAKKDAEFNRLIAVGDEDVKQLKYTEAIGSFKSALEIRPGDAVALARIANAERLIALAGEKAKKEAEFSRLIAAGDKEVSAKKYAEALTLYKSALLIMDNEIVNSKIAQTELLFQQAENDRIRLEAERQAIALKEQKYKEAIAKADQLFASKIYADAKSFYQQASSIDMSASYPRDRIQEIEKIMAQLQADALIREKENANMKLYNEAINRGGSYFSTKQYSDAIIAYSEAQKIRPSEILPAQKIKEIQLIMDALAAKALADEKSAAEAKISASERLYLEKLKIADENFKKAQWSVARFYYIEVLKIRQGDNYSLDKIEACDKMIDSGITAERMQEYKNKIVSADGEMKARNYSSAKFYYRGASDILKWETYPLQQLKEIDRLIAEKLTESDLRIFKDNLKKADDAFDHKEYPTSRFYYNKAIEISQSDHVTSRLAEIESIMNGTESKKINAAYDDFVKKGNEAMNQKNSSIARFYFQKANNLKPDEKYPKEELKRIDSGEVNP